MNKISYILPGGAIISCEKHRELVKEFIRKLKELNIDYYYRAKNVLNEFYTKHGYCNYDDFACFSLGWIKITKGLHKYAVFAGYDFQYEFLERLSCDVRLEEVPNIYRYPLILFENIDYQELFN